MLPKLKFKIDYKKDVSSFLAFLRDAEFDEGRSLDWAVLKIYPYFKKYKSGPSLKINKKEVESFVKDFYDKNRAEMEKNLKAYEEDWNKKEKEFYSLAQDLFGSKKWPNGKYIAYPTIWGMYPRFLENKTFQLPYKCKNKKSINTTIAHEMLHFIFYDYFYEKYPEYSKDEFNFFLWNVSEIFNSVIQNSPTWIKVFKTKNMDYPEHGKIIKNLSEKYHKKDEIFIDELTKDIIKEAKTIC
ncbi:MAG: hypothetical protein V1770_05160 [bacterium]